MKNKWIILGIAFAMGAAVFGCGPTTPTMPPTAFIPPSTEVPTEVPTIEPEVPTAIPTEVPTTGPVVPAGWLLYTNPYFGYQFYYPPDATISESGVSGYPTDELPEGKTPSEYMAELQALYGDTLCVGVHYGTGYVNFSAPANEGFRYALCGRTGVGVGTMTDKSETIVISGNSYTASGFEFVGQDVPCDLLPCHNETMVLLLPDDMRIEYGAAPVETVTYADYLATTRPVLLQIVSTFVPGP
ncbi:MAG: hypothetical protein AB8I69_19290 [Anaerolineae bacterium]